MRKNNKVHTLFYLLTLILVSSISWAKSGIVVFQSDFGIKDGAVSEVKGVMYTVDRGLIVSDLTHEIPAYNIWEASYRLYQTAPYWPEHTVFVSVVDPGVGTKRRSVVALTNKGQYFVTPDNGTLTLIDDFFGIKEVREIDETRNRLKGSTASHTFFGRDVYGYTAAKLASGKISFSEVGPVLKAPVIKLPYQKPVIENNKLRGTIVILDAQYGNVWTNIDKKLLEEYGFKINERYKVTISHNKIEKYSDTLTYQKTFNEIPKGSNLLYLNSLLNLAIAKNQGDFAKSYHIGSGPDWVITISKEPNK
ncbi:S-adenosyl-l-methionine hydroxide adenosyltransferase family protein [Fluoribacter dumoffii]|uniref:S-adenosyl-l-methionine hydroxide adenosyltransferase n=1 Tax=Fluoribacter dumoffii TaxID=463 RepID=A0A377G8J6_9GAMM|nr:S-adenosyl-l-methionine hydroxide adenosyltransferase family protein [Fluoribacter dumoffii]KTC89834.1 Adenosyl-chloride synthase [Fluoribacter dumoffii NY 23]MCW8385129.1 S-adenosyl-l-methionine hydroxide adenosyltransferase family protein [Fluoribacter dumoffii]MCW8418185.1 S-adenosyl-l-methionine hydroxide adenosyltransferase family protein [Fluoribacter dumoffii]MCW8453973.1 S-adenosyl-l-methionine hydroxide adenosyltransferase family protein [Fluoribacter dumoffii]MCW8461956.1 S-adenos